jgi:uncharacterized protein YndB with AHSA1/START domain
MATTTDRIEKKVHLRATRERVWKALTEAKRFGYWFGMDFDGEFAPGRRMAGRIEPTKVDPTVAKMQEPLRGIPFEFVIDRIEPMNLFSMRWHPHALEQGKDYSPEPMTAIQFALEDEPGGTLLTITESGFDRIPVERRAEAFEANSGGWDHQGKMLASYLALDS